MILPRYFLLLLALLAPCGCSTARWVNRDCHAVSREASEVLGYPNEELQNCIPVKKL